MIQGKSTLPCQCRVNSQSRIAFVGAYLFCWITPGLTREFLFFSLWKVVLRSFEAPCEVWCKFTFSSVNFNLLFAYYPGCYLVDSVTTYTCWCCLCTLVTITSESKYQSVMHHLKLSFNISQAPFKVPRKADNLTV